MQDFFRGLFEGDEQLNDQKATMLKCYHSSADKVAKLEHSLEAFSHRGVFQRHILELRDRFLMVQMMDV